MTPSPTVPYDLDPERGLWLFRASRLEDLLVPLDTLLRALPPADPLAPQTVLVGHPGLRHWLRDGSRGAAATASSRTSTSFCPAPGWTAWPVASSASRCSASAPGSAMCCAGDCCPCSPASMNPESSPRSPAMSTVGKRLHWPIA